MLVKYLIIFFVLAVFVIYCYLQYIGHYEFELFAYNICLTIRNVVLQVNVKTFDKKNNELFVKKENIYYKFVSKDICLIRFDQNLTFHPKRIFPLCVYKVIIKNDKYIMKLKIPILYIIFFGILIFSLVGLIFLGHKMEISNFIIIGFLSAFSLFSIIISWTRMNEVINNFKEIIFEL
ncbi:MAG: hypothetical protein LBH43_00040 [Treponema sp.]|jgi:hypothetical protein|nr:hypothetical protein [Treponema sp.]